MTTRLKISESIWTRLREHHFAEGKREESLTYAFARSYRRGDSLTVLVPHNALLFAFDKDCFTNQSAGNCRLDVDVLRALMAEFAATDYDVLINIHDHWFDDYTRFSSIDDADDTRFDRYLRGDLEPTLRDSAQMGPARHILNLSIVMAREGVTARLTDTRLAGPFLQFDTVDVIGERFARLSSSQPGAAVEPVDSVARQRDFVPAHVQVLMKDLHVAVVGCGGLGSIIAETLARLGIGSLSLIDDDRLEATNLNRWQGAKPADVGEPKSEVLAARIREMLPEVNVRPIVASLHDTQVQRLLADTDIVVGGLDNDIARYLLNRLSVQYLLPYLDAATVVSRAGDDTYDFRSRFYSVVPGVTACLECSEFEHVNLEEARRMFADAATVASQRSAGYIADAPQAPAPSVYPLNQRSAALLVMELMNFLTGYQPLARVISESWRRAEIQRADGTTVPERPSESCALCSYHVGAGDSEPLPRLGDDAVVTTDLNRLWEDGEPSDNAAGRRCQSDYSHDAVAEAPKSVAVNPRGDNS